MTAAIYARYSTDLQRETSIDDQVRRCIEIAEQLGVDKKSILVFNDEACSGTAKHDQKRQGYHNLLDAWARGEFSILIVDEVSRISRDAVQLAELQRRVEQTGVRFITANGIDSAQSNWQLMLGVTSIVSQQAVRDTRHRVTRGMVGQLERGYMIAPPAYGYTNERVFDENDNRIGTHWYVAPESEIVKKIFLWRKGGAALGAIAKKLNESNIPPPRPGRNNDSYWRPATISRLLANPIYRGVFIWHGSHAYIKDAKKCNRDPETRCYPRPDLCIVDDDIWYACNEKKISRSGYGGGRHAFSGVVTCGTCGAVLSVGMGGNSPSLYCAQCSQARRVGVSRARTGYLAISGLKEVLIAAIRSMMAPDVAAEFRERLKSRLTQSVEDELAQAKIEKDLVTRSCARLARAIRFTDDGEFLLNEYSEVMRERQRLEGIMKELESRRSAVDKHAIQQQLNFDPEALVSRIFDVDRSPENVRALLTRLFDEIVFESKPERHVAIIRVTCAPGMLAAMATDTVAMDVKVTTLRFKLMTSARRPTVWNVQCLPCEQDSDTENPARSNSQSTGSSGGCADRQ